MFLNDVNKKEEIRNLAVQDLRNLGVKYRSKKRRQLQEVKSRKVFKTPLHCLPMQTVTLDSGQQLVVPKLVYELCSYILTKVDTEGLFRKGGSKSRQNEIRLSLDASCRLGDDHHEIDVASILKTFFRELPEPLFPYSYHDLFLHCIILPAKNLEAVLLACLLLPCEHLNTLAYFMQFLNQVTQYSLLNKMDAYNLAVILGPTLFPVEEKVATYTSYRLTRTCELFKMLIENASAIGFLPESIIERIALSSSSTSLTTDDENAGAKKKKKRRSGSLTRMFNGLKKMVSSKSNDETPNVITPDLLLTPCMTQSTKKRKSENGGFSAKKKKEILNKLPQNSALSTPYISTTRTPVSANPNPKKITPPDTCRKSLTTKSNGTKDKKSQWLLKNKLKNSNGEVTGNETRGLLERRWSQVSQVANLKKNKKRNSCNEVSEQQKNLPPASNLEPDYVRISKIEYEEIKNRVSAIEKRLSIELDNHNAEKTNNIENVQCAYEQILVNAESLSPTTDHLARRLSRDLKIRRSAEQKIIRSPSARKIGSLRRRSRELEKQTKLNRTQSWNVPKTENNQGTNTKPNNETERRKSSNFVTLPLYDDESNKIDSNKWNNATGFFANNSQTPCGTNKESSRSSLVRLRNQNAGMVLAKAKLFDALVDSDSSSQSATLPRSFSNKIGNVDRQSYRVKALKTEDKRVNKKCVSPRKRVCKSPNFARQQRLNIVRTSNLADVLNKENNINEANLLSYVSDSPNCITSKNYPPIKRTFNVKSPKRLNRTPLRSEKQGTPLKVIPPIRQHY